MKNETFGFLWLVVNIASFVGAFFYPLLAAIPLMLLIAVVFGLLSFIRRRIGCATLWSDVFPSLVKESL